VSPKPAARIALTALSLNFERNFWW